MPTAYLYISFLYHPKHFESDPPKFASYDLMQNDFFGLTAVSLYSRHDYSHDYNEVEEICKTILNQTKHRPSIGIICGTGLSSLGDIVGEKDDIPYEKIKQFPRSTGTKFNFSLVIYCAFHKHTNSKIQKPRAFTISFFTDVNHNYDYKQWTLKHRNTPVEQIEIHQSQILNLDLLNLFKQSSVS